MARLQSIFICTAMCALAAGCAGDGRPREASASVEAPPRAWPRSFERRAVLTARSIEIVGPRGLLEHVAIVQDSENHTHLVTAVREGLRIEERLKDGVVEPPIRAQLDNLELAAFESLVVLESVNAERVVIQAEGDVYWRVFDTGAEQRRATLRIVGEDEP